MLNPYERDAIVERLCNEVIIYSAFNRASSFVIDAEDVAALSGIARRQNAPRRNIVFEDMTHSYLAGDRARPFVVTGSMSARERLEALEHYLDDGRRRSLGVSTETGSYPRFLWQCLLSSFMSVEDCAPSGMMAGITGPNSLYGSLARILRRGALAPNHSIRAAFGDWQTSSRSPTGRTHGDEKTTLRSGGFRAAIA